MNWIYTSGRAHRLWVVLLWCMCSLVFRRDPTYAAEQAPPPQTTDDMVTLDREIRQSIDTLREVSLMKALALPRERADLVLQKIQAVRVIRQQYLLQRTQLESTLEQALSIVSPEPRSIYQILQDLESVQKTYYQQMVAADQELRLLLSPEEQAKYVVFQKNFNKRLQEVILQIRQQRSQTSDNALFLLRKQAEESVIRQP